MAGSVTQANGTTPSLGSIPNPLGMQVYPEGCVVVIGTLLSYQIPTCLVLHISGIELQLVCGESAMEVELFILFPGFPRRGCYHQHKPWM